MAVTSWGRSARRNATRQGFRGITNFQPAQEWDGDRWRWTTGDAVLSSSLWGAAPGPVDLTLRLAPERGVLRAWQQPDGIGGSAPRESGAQRDGNAP